MDTERKPIGSVKIDKNVLATIGKKATLEIEGVSNVRSSKVSICDGLAVINLTVVFKSDIKVPMVCEKIQCNVKESIQSMTSVVVSKVNIIADGINY